MLSRAHSFRDGQLTCPVARPATTCREFMAASFAITPVGFLTAATLPAGGPRLSGASRASVLAPRPRSSPPSPTPSAASATITVPEWPTTSPVGRSFDCTRHVKRSGSRSGIAPADPRHRSRPGRPLRRPRDAKVVTNQPIQIACIHTLLVLSLFVYSRTLDLPV